MERLKLNENELNNILDTIKDICNKDTKLSKLVINGDQLAKTLLPKEITKPVIKIPSDVYLKILSLVTTYNEEINWHGLVKRNEEKNKFLIYDVLMFPQITSPTRVTTNQEEYGAWFSNLIMDENFPIEDMRMHGHSHVNMAVFSSGIDDAYQEDLLTKIKDDDYYIFMIMNKKAELCVLLYDYYNQILFMTEDITFQIIDNKMNDINDWTKKEIEKYCKKEKVNYTKNKYYTDEDPDLPPPEYYYNPKKKGKKHGFKQK